MQFHLVNAWRGPAPELTGIFTNGCVILLRNLRFFLAYPSDARLRINGAFG